MIIALSGKSSSGKDTVGEIFQYLIDMKSINDTDMTFDLWKRSHDSYRRVKCTNWEIKKFAYKVKVITSLLTGIRIEDLEKEEVKNSLLGEEWIRYGYADGFYHYYNNGKQTTVMNNKQCDRETYLAQSRTNWQTAYKHEMTVREFMYSLATNAVRDQVHQDTWINALFVDYKNKWDDLNLARKLHDEVLGEEYPNWIITDFRFENEGEAIELRDGVKIRVERDLSLRYPKEFKDYSDIIMTDVEYNDGFTEYIQYNNSKLHAHLTHQSEIELDKYVGTDYFKHTLTNNGSLEDLIKQCEDILIKENII